MNDCWVSLTTENCFRGWLFNVCPVARDAVCRDGLCFNPSFSAYGEPFDPHSEMVLHHQLGRGATDLAQRIPIRDLKHFVYH
uniref:Uncharacterized protein n=1 Tax=Daphnia magna TaxID=35525 RepID=A0A0P6B785_9CRUS